MNHKEIMNQIIEAIISFDRIIILRHKRPDGDCVGSSLGLRDMLRASFPTKTVVTLANDRADYVDFLGEVDCHTFTDKEIEESLVIVVDTATKDRIDGVYFDKAKTTIKIDHHIAVDSYATINYVREDFPSCASMIMDIADLFSDVLIVPKSAAIALYVAVVTDTGRFRYSGVNGRVMSLAGNMIDQGLVLEEIYANLYIKDAASLKLQGYVLRNFKQTSSGVATIYFSKRTQQKYGVTPEDAAALVNVLDSIKGSLIWIAFVEQKDKTIRVRLRSRFVSIVEIGQVYRGGGHKQASGATVLSKTEMNELIQMADNIHHRYKQEHPEVF